MLCYRGDTRCIPESGSLYNTGHKTRATSCASYQPLSKLFQSVQLQQVHPRRSATTSVPSRHRYQLLYILHVIEGNWAALYTWIQNRYPSSTFNTCECLSLPLSEGEPYKLHVDPEARPTAVHKPNPAHLHCQHEVKASIDRDVKLGILEVVPVGEQVVWFHRMVTARKKTASHDAQWTCRCSTNMLSVKHTTPDPPFTRQRFTRQRFTRGDQNRITDAWNGNNRVPIGEKGRHLTTFITDTICRYRYKTCPQGYAVSQNGYTRRLDGIVNDFPTKTKCIDDTCLWAGALEESFFQTCHWVDICGGHGIVQNPITFEFDTVEFVGFVISPTDTQPSASLSAQCVTFLRHKTSLTSVFDSAL